jgi:hypothetical protein
MNDDRMIDRFIAHWIIASLANKRHAAEQGSAADDEQDSSTTTAFSGSM